ncbi:hypothetical protein LMG18090_03632 [Ralstonia mannitolilytica]|uniref:ATP-binding protein n=1 Tax=Ralstonia mannitolilytica TaxID=105219 RepID=UPI0028F5217A|nr:ATP-binding protein [Ralstonia mannitolilytica]CAJ0797907.1 hypothetical protein LMG18090_03632 [Ralstonia mannitolilytica]
MSIAAIRSNRGDGYQTLVALDWALMVLSDQNYEWLEVDSVAYSVDDIVVGKTDGTKIACQCKKNQTDFKAWTIADLADELDKASQLLADDKSVEVRFYSRNNFGELAKLREHSTTQFDEASYRASLGKEHQIVDAALSARLATSASGLSTFEFLRRTKFSTSEELDRMAAHVRERLRYMVSNPDSAFDALWVCVDQLGARINDSTATASQHRLTKDDLTAVLDKAGAILTPPIDLAEVRLSFSSTSAIGRSWRRDIAGRRISSPVLSELISAIDEKKKAILLTGLPGSGKTCVMLALQEELEARAKTRSDLVPLFIQSREFADLVTSEDRQDHGLSERWVEKSARMADGAHVVVVIDSLDVLSIARDHRVLKYFLAQVDRLLLIPNITVVTACRDFDRHYDRRIAERQWDRELKCQPLDWNTQIEPLLDTLAIATSAIDAVTRELIRNPRELALFVELAEREGSFNVVTSQALAQRYLDTIVRSNDTLGDAAILAIESIASEMLSRRSLVVPLQRFPASQGIRRELCSLNVLQETQDGKLAFGHQTLLDVLVISGAVRSGVTLNEFIQGLPPVPFVRPSIRSFVAQLALGERRDFRKQLRAVLTGSAAFHIRRLVAESLAEQIPQDDDWPLIWDLRRQHRDVFQVVYASATAIEWHHFWLKHLVPAMKALRDAEGLTGHVHRVAQWVNNDRTSVLAFWTEALSLDWFDGNGIADQLGIYLSHIKSGDLALVAPLLIRLLDMPRSEHSFLGRVLGRCVAADVVEDALLWRYIAGGVTDEDLLEYSFDRKLRCNAHEFREEGKNFLQQRMEQSATLLGLAVESIERWSRTRASRYGEMRGGYRHGFLGETSYEDAHTRRDIRHADNMDVLLDAIEAAILHHAKEDSEWWQNNRERLCFNQEGSLLYFAILACTASPETNVDLIGRMLCDSQMLMSKLSYELGTLAQSAFVLLDAPVQDAVMAKFMTVWDEKIAGEPTPCWILKKRVELIISVPCHLRSPEAQVIVDMYKDENGVLNRQPDIHSGGGVVSAPFSFEVFLDASDSGVLSLLEHYNGHSDRGGVDFLIGGEREVGWQLREASSRNPTRFLRLLSSYWHDIPVRFRDDIMDGVATYLAYRHGNLQTNGAWTPIEEPDAPLLASLILTELEKHPRDWHHRRAAAKALEACANVIGDAQDAARLTFLATGFETLREDDPIKGDNVNLINVGINMIKGDIAEALMILIANLSENQRVLPDLLAPTLRRLANDEHPAIRALILRRLPYLQSRDFDFGWRLFDLAMPDTKELWEVAEPCLYYAYHNHFEMVGPLLARLRTGVSGGGLEPWGRISALAAMTKHLDFAEFLRSLTDQNSSDAWRGAATVWANSGNIRQHREMCIAGIEAGLSAGGDHAKEVAAQMDHVFRGHEGAILVPVDLIRRCLCVFESDSESKNHKLFGFHEWINEIAQIDPMHALSAAEAYLDYVKRNKPYLYDHENSLTQLMTRLFSESEEREESDGGAMLQRVVAVQDILLSIGVNGVADWLKAAERP